MDAGPVAVDREYIVSCAAVDVAGCRSAAAVLSLYRRPLRTGETADHIAE